MPEIIKVYRENSVKLRFIGKKYDNADRLNGSFSVKEKWNEWFKHSWFDILENITNKSRDSLQENKNTYIGLLRNKPKEPFQYWIGIFAPDNTEIPDGFECIDFPKSEIAVCRVCGEKTEIYLSEGLELFDFCNKRLKEKEINHAHDKDNVCWVIERYNSNFFMKNDDNENIIMEVGFFTDFDY